MSKKYTLKVTPQEFDNILAALRAYETLLHMNSAICQDVEEIAEEHGEAFGPEEVGNLCERLNCQ